MLSSILHTKHLLTFGDPPTRKDLENFRTEDYKKHEESKVTRSEDPSKPKREEREDRRSNAEKNADWQREQRRKQRRNLE